MNYCKDYESALNALLDGECSPEEAQRVREHLAVCPGCLAYFETLTLLRGAFPDAEDTEVPDGFAESVCAAIRADAAPQKKPKSRWLKAALPLAACFAIAIGVGSRSLGGGSPLDAATASDAGEASVTYPESAQQPETAQGSAALAAGAPTDQASAFSGGASSDSAASGGTAASKNGYGFNQESVGDASGTYALCAQVTLSEELRGSLLGSFESTEESGFRRYALSREDFDALVNELDRREIPVELTTGSEEKDLCCLDVYPAG